MFDPWKLHSVALNKNKIDKKCCLITKPHQKVKGLDHTTQTGGKFANKTQVWL